MFLQQTTIILFRKYSNDYHSGIPGAPGRLLEYSRGGLGPFQASMQANSKQLFGNFFGEHLETSGYS